MSACRDEGISERHPSPHPAKLPIASRKREERLSVHRGRKHRFKYRVRKVATIASAKLSCSSSGGAGGGKAELGALQDFRKAKQRKGGSATSYFITMHPDGNDGV